MGTNMQVEKDYQAVIPIFASYLLNTNYSRSDNKKYLYIFSKFTYNFTFLGGIRRM